MSVHCVTNNNKCYALFFRFHINYVSEIYLIFPLFQFVKNMDGNYYWTIAVIIWTQIRLILKSPIHLNIILPTFFLLSKKKKLFPNPIASWTATRKHYLTSWGRQWYLNIFWINWCIPFIIYCNNPSLGIFKVHVAFKE